MQPIIYSMEAVVQRFDNVTIFTATNYWTDLDFMESNLDLDCNH